MTQDSELTYKANKIFVFYKDDMTYSWYISSTDESTLIGRKRVDMGTHLKHSHYSSNESDDSYFLIEKIIKLLKDGYSINTDKNRSGITMKTPVLKKFISMVRKYYGENDSLDRAFLAFLKYYSYDDIEFMKTIMTDINSRIEEIKNKIPLDIYHGNPYI